MTNSQDPFETDDGFENIPVVQKPVQAVNKVANTVVKQTAQQIKATTKAFISQLYGSSSPTATDDDQQQDATVNAAAHAQKVQTPTPIPTAVAAAHTPHSIGQTTAVPQTAEEQEKLAEARRNLQQHSSEYYDPTFGNIADIETGIRQEAQKNQQEEQQKEQEEEQEEQQKMELEEKKKKEPIAVTRARNKAEMNRGAAG